MPESKHNRFPAFSFSLGSPRVPRARFRRLAESIGITRLICCSARRGAEQAGRLRYPSATRFRRPVPQRVCNSAFRNHRNDTNLICFGEPITIGFDNPQFFRGHSSVGRAPALQAGSQGFESPCLQSQRRGGKIYNPGTLPDR